MTDRKSLHPESWIFRNCSPVRRQLVLSVFWTLCAGCAVIFQARFLSLGCHQLVIDHAPLAQVLPLAGAVAALALLRAALQLGAEWQSAAAGATLKQHLRDLLTRSLHQASSSRLRTAGTGPLVEAATAGIDDLEPYVTRFLPQLAVTALVPALVLAVVIPAEWRTSLVLVFSAPFIPLLMLLIGRGAENRNRRQWRHLTRMAGHFLDLVRGLPDLRICGAAKREAAVVARVAEEYRHSTMAIMRLAFLSALVLEFFSTVGTAVAAVIIGFQLLHGSLDLADGLFILLLAPEFYLPFRTLGLSYHARMKGIAAAERIAPLLETAIEPFPALQAAPGRATAPTIRFQQVSCRREEGRGRLLDITLDLPAGSFTVLTGESGSGKTTLARLLAGLLQPDGGSITIDGTAIGDIPLQSWHAGMAWVSQQPFFFTGTVRENLLLGAVTGDERSLYSALDATGARPFLDRLPDGLDTPMADRGSGFSGGELRRLALARALLRNASLLVLDEPTAGLDRGSEGLILRTIRNCTPQSTVLAISHREAVIAAADRVALLDCGRLRGMYLPGSCHALRGNEP